MAWEVKDPIREAAVVLLHRHDASSLNCLLNNCTYTHKLLLLLAFVM